MDLQPIIAVDGAYFFPHASYSLFGDGLMWIVSCVSIWIPAGATWLYVLFKNNKLPEMLLTLLMLVVTYVAADQLALLLAEYRWGSFQGITSVSNLSYRCIEDMLSGRGVYSLLEIRMASIFAVVLFISWTIRNLSLTIMLMVGSLLLSYSQIYWGVQALADLILGLLEGCFIGVISYLFYRFVQKKYFYESYCISNQYTSSGYLISDIQLLNSVLLLTFFIAITVGLIAVSRFH